MLRDKDFIYFNDTFFQVLGYIHPVNKAFVIPRYIRVDYATYWRNDFYYARILEDYSSASLARIQVIFKEFLKYDPYLDTNMLVLDLDKAKEIIRTNEWNNRVKSNSLLNLFKELREIIIKNSNIRSEDIGLTGSLLINIANMIYSDIDIVIYGYFNVEKVKEFILGSNKFEIIKPEIIKGLDENSFKKISKRKWNRIKYKNKYISIVPVMKFEEIENKYGEFKIKNLFPIKVKLKIYSKNNPYFYPLSYSVKLIEEDKYKIEELVIFEMYYLDLFEENDTLEVIGMLQKVEEKDKEYFRIAYGLRELEHQSIRLL